MGQPVRNELKVPNPFLRFQFVLHAMIEYLTFSFYDFISYDFLWNINSKKKIGWLHVFDRGKKEGLSLSLSTQNWGSSGFSGSYVYVSHYDTPATMLARTVRGNDLLITHNSIVTFSCKLLYTTRKNNQSIF